MKPIPASLFTNQLYTLLRETFEGPPLGESSVFLDAGGGLLQLLENLSAADASNPPKPGMPTIAAHCAHLIYYNDILRQYMEGTVVRGDWEGSWRTQKVNAKEWNALCTKLRKSYETLVAAAETRSRWNENAVGAAMAILVHTTYHLSAIRAAIRFAK